MTAFIPLLTWVSFIVSSLLVVPYYQIIRDDAFYTSFPIDIRRNISLNYMNKRDVSQSKDGRSIQPVKSVPLEKTTKSSSMSLGNTTKDKGIVNSVKKEKESSNRVISKRDYRYSRFITLPTTPYKTVGKKEIEFFPWNDGINYGEICNKILKRITRNDTFYVISDSTPGGIGHKYTSLLHSLTYAILTGRRFIVKTKDAFWNETNPCIRNLRYTGPLNLFRICGKHNHCRDINKFSILHTPPNENLVFRDLRPKLFSTKNLQVMYKLGIIPQNKSWKYYQRVLLRLLLNPSPDNIQLIQKRWNQVGSVQLSVHIRCGGLIADSKERISMISPSQLSRIPSQIESTLKKQHLLSNTVPAIYLSTDSSKAYSTIRNKLSTVKVYSLESRRGHTTGGNFRNLRMSLVDMYMLCKSQSFLGTSTSSFSFMARVLCDFKSVSSISGQYFLIGTRRSLGMLFVCFTHSWIQYCINQHTKIGITYSGYGYRCTQF